MKDTERTTITFCTSPANIVLDFTDVDQNNRDQFVRYFAAHDMNDFGTLLNLKDWASARKIPCEINARWWTLRGLVLVLVYMPLCRWLAERGFTVIKPVAKKKSG